MDEQLPTLWNGEDADLVRGRLVKPLRVERVAKEDYLQDINGTYYAIGGYQRLAHTANEHPKWFYERYLRPGILLPDEHQSMDVTFHIHPALQRSALDEPIEGEFDVKDNDQHGTEQAQAHIPEGRATPVSGRSRRGEDPSGQDGGSLALALAQDKEAGRSGSRT